VQDRSAAAADDDALLDGSEALFLDPGAILTRGHGWKFKFATGVGFRGLRPVRLSRAQNYFRGLRRPVIGVVYATPDITKDVRIPERPPTMTHQNARLISGNSDVSGSNRSRAPSQWQPEEHSTRQTR